MVLRKPLRDFCHTPRLRLGGRLGSHAADEKWFLTAAPRGVSMGRRPSRDRSTIGDVATQAGVSRATVSRVMNGLSTVDPRIAARVRATAVELDYRPNQVARSLALGRTQTIGYVVPDLTNPSFHGGLRGLSRAAADHGYRVLVADSAEHAEDEPLLALETRRRCDAVVLVAPRMS